MHSRSFRLSAFGGLGLASALVWLQLGLAQEHTLSRRVEPSYEQRILEARDPQSKTKSDYPGSKGRKTTDGKGHQLKFVLTSDSHGTYGKQWKQYDSLPDGDVLVHTGDVTDEGRLEEYQNVIKSLSNHPAMLKIFIGGNHDFTLDKKYMATMTGSGAPDENPVPTELRGDKSKVDKETSAAYQVFTSDDAKKAGIRLLPEGTHKLSVLTKEGRVARFTVFVSPYTPEFHHYAFAYDKSVDRFNDPSKKTSYIASRGLNRPDIILTHGPPLNIQDKTVTGYHAGDPSLAKALKRIKPLFHAFGHIHEAYGTVKVDWTAGDKQTPILDTNIDLTKPGMAFKRGEATVCLNTAQRDLAMLNVNSWRTITLNWSKESAKKRKNAKDPNDPKSMRSKRRKLLNKVQGKTDEQIASGEKKGRQ